MIEIKKADNSFKTEHNIENEAYICTDKDKLLGILEYEMKEKDLILTNLDCDDNMIADGLVRQTMNNALDNGSEFCKYNERIGKRLFELRIIKKIDEKSIDILDFFMKINHI